METTDIVLHKGEKDEKYQLYVEDYVMSYLKNYGNLDDRNIFFFGRSEQKDKRYYIYGAGRQEQISYFIEYELLREITCHYETDMPVFSVREDTGNYDLAGYYIFYHSNEAMQSYMIEQRKLLQDEEKDKTKEDIQMQERSRRTEAIQLKSKSKGMPETVLKEKNSGKSRGGLMAVQLAAIFVILAAIIINSTNSYTKLSDLNQAATEVFFAMENEKAADVQEKTDMQGETDMTEGVILRLEDIDAKFEEENQAAQKEAAEDEDEKAEEETNEEKGINDTEEVSEKVKEDVTEEKNEENIDPAEEETEAEIEEPSSEEEIAKQAFARNFAEYYQIEKGDTLCTISIKMYGDASKVNEICELNKISDPDHIKYGQKILLP